MRHRRRITPILASLAAMWRYEIASRSQAITTMEMKNTQECVVLMRGVGTRKTSQIIRSSNEQKIMDVDSFVLKHL